MNENNRQSLDLFLPLFSVRKHCDQSPARLAPCEHEKGRDAAQPEVVGRLAAYTGSRGPTIKDRAVSSDILMLCLVRELKLQFVAAASLSSAELTVYTVLYLSMDDLLGVPVSFACRPIDLRLLFVINFAPILL